MQDRGDDEFFGSNILQFFQKAIQYIFSDAPSQIEARILNPKGCNKVTPSQNAVVT
jgi:hypothetical protein